MKWQEKRVRRDVTCGPAVSSSIIQFHFHTWPILLKGINSLEPKALFFWVVYLISISQFKILTDRLNVSLNRWERYDKRGEKNQRSADGYFDGGPAFKVVWSGPAGQNETMGFCCSLALSSLNLSKTLGFLDPWNACQKILSSDCHRPWIERYVVRDLTVQNQSYLKVALQSYESKKKGKKAKRFAKLESLVAIQVETLLFFFVFFTVGTYKSDACSWITSTRMGRVLLVFLFE